MRSPALIRSKSSQARTYSFWALSNFAATISAAQRLLGDDDAEFLVNPLAEIDDPPSHHAMNGGDRAALDDRGQRGSVRIVQPRRLSWRLAINQTVRPVRVELEHPIANDLKRHTANLRRLGASCPFVNRRQSQKPPCLRTILRSFRGGPDHLRVKISPKRNGHGEPPLFATLNHVATDLKIPMRVTFSETWYYRARQFFGMGRYSRLCATIQETREKMLRSSADPAASRALPTSRASGSCSKGDIAQSRAFPQIGGRRAGLGIQRPRNEGEAIPGRPAFWTTFGVSIRACSAFRRVRPNRSIRNNACCSSSSSKPARTPAYRPRGWRGAAQASMSAPPRSIIRR